MEEKKKGGFKVVEKEDKVQGKVTIGDKAKKQIDNKKIKTKLLNKTILPIILLVVLIVLIIGVVVGGRLLNKAKLDKEVDLLIKGEVNLNNIEIKTSGNFAKVEQTLKEYFKEYTQLQQSMLGRIEDEKLQKILTIENYQNDGPEFVESKKYIQESKAALETEINRLKELTNEDAIMSKIKEKKVSGYYINLYKSYLFEGQDLTKEFESVNTELDSTKQIMDSLYNTEIKILDFLTENKEHWKIQNSRIVFDSVSVSAQFNSLKTQLNAQ